MDIGTMVGMLSEGFVMTLQIFFLTLIGSVPLGVIIAFGRMNSWAPFKFLAAHRERTGVIGAIARFCPISALTSIYISIMRGTPLMLQMFAIYFGPYYVFGLDLSPDSKYQACIVAFIINYAAYFAEIYRGGIQAVPRGQYEAASVLGYSRTQTFFRIVLPQVTKNILPAMGNEIITLVKDTSLAFAIGVAEMFSVAKALVASQANMFPFVIAALFYWVFNFFVEIILNFAEKKMNYYHD